MCVSVVSVCLLASLCSAVSLLLAAAEPVRKSMQSEILPLQAATKRMAAIGIMPSMHVYVCLYTYIHICAHIMVV